jgi:hypothetical protein
MGHMFGGSADAGASSTEPHGARRLRRPAPERQPRHIQRAAESGCTRRLNPGRIFRGPDRPGLQQLPRQLIFSCLARCIWWQEAGGPPRNPLALPPPAAPDRTQAPRLSPPPLGSRFGRWRSLGTPHRRGVGAGRRRRWPGNRVLVSRFSGPLFPACVPARPTVGTSRARRKARTSCGRGRFVTSDGLRKLVPVARAWACKSGRPGNEAIGYEHVQMRRMLCPDVPRLKCGGCVCRGDVVGYVKGPWHQWVPSDAGGRMVHLYRSDHGLGARTSGRFRSNAATTRLVPCTVQAYGSAHEPGSHPPGRFSLGRN